MCLNPAMSCRVPARSRNTCDRAEEIMSRFLTWILKYPNRYFPSYLELKSQQISLLKVPHLRLLSVSEFC
jgi:hypothetical protein